MSNEHLVWYIGVFCAVSITIIWSLISNLRDAITVLEEQRKEDRRYQLKMDGSLKSVLLWIAKHDGKGLVQNYPGSEPVVEYGPHKQAPPTFLSKSDLPDDTLISIAANTGKTITIDYGAAIKELVEKQVELQMRGLVDQVIATRNTHKQITWDLNGIQERLDRLEVFTGTEAGHKDQDDELIGHS